MFEKRNFTQKKFASKQWNECDDTYNDEENVSMTTTLKKINNIWYINSGCSNHMFGNIVLFNQATNIGVPKWKIMRVDMCYIVKCSGDFNWNDVTKTLHHCSTYP